MTTKKKRQRPTVDLATIRTAVADYMYSEGCSCCQDIDEHKKNAATLAKLLHVKKYPDGSGYDFFRYSTKKQEERKKARKKNAS